MARRPLTLEGTAYPSQKEWFAALSVELLDLEQSGWYAADDLIRDVALACRWMPDEWAEWITDYAIRPSRTDKRYTDRNPDKPILWVRLDDGAQVCVGWHSITRTRHEALSGWMRAAIEPQIEEERQKVRDAGGYTCAYGGETYRGTRRLQIDHGYEFSSMLQDFLDAHTGKTGATADDVEFAHPEDEELLKGAFIPYHREVASLQPMCGQHNGLKEKERKAAIRAAREGQR